MVLPPEQLDAPLVTEEQLVYLADKLVVDDRIAGLEEREARALADMARKTPRPPRPARGHGRGCRRRRSSASAWSRSSAVPWKRCCHEATCRPVPSRDDTSVYRSGTPNPSARRPQALSSGNPTRRSAPRAWNRRTGWRSVLRSIHFDAAYSSDLRRMPARRPRSSPRRRRRAPRAEVPAVRPDRRLREIDAGLWEGLSLRRGHGVVSRRSTRERERDLVGYRFPGGESFRDLQQTGGRRPSATSSPRDGGANILVVAHRGVNRVLLCQLLGLPLEELFSIEQDYGCVNLIEASVRPDGTRETDVTTPW